VLGAASGESAQRQHSNDLKGSASYHDEIFSKGQAMFVPRFEPSKETALCQCAK
jgi:hypothetical protein